MWEKHILTVTATVLSPTVYYTEKETVIGEKGHT
jgi:hypothetical protein